MAVKRNKVLMVESDGVELPHQQELDLSASESLYRLGGAVHSCQERTVSAGILQLTDQDVMCHYFNGTTAGQIVRMPDATTLSHGRNFEFWNYSTQEINIQDYGGNTLATLRANGRTEVMLREIAGPNGPWAVTYTLDNGNVFGTQIYQVEAEAETSNDSGTTWATKLTLTTPADLPAGDYLLNFQFIWRSSSANREADFRFQHDGVDIVAWQPSTARVQDRQLLSGFKRVEGISGVNTFTFQFKYANSSTTIYVAQARMFLWRVA